MKKLFLGATSVATLLMFGACSSDSSSPEIPIQSSSSIVPIVDPTDPNNPIVDPTDPTNPTVDPTDPTTDPDENPADQPISDDEKIDDGTASVDALNISVAGLAEVGPFTAGASVSIAGVDAKTMAVGAPSVETSVINNLGAYSATGVLNSAIGSFDVSGTYYNFSTSAGASITSLKAISDMRSRNSVNINVLTHLEYPRVQYLVSTMGLSFTAAKERAEKEVLAALGFKSDSTLFEDISVYHMTDAAANLLSITGALLADPSATEMLLNAAAADIAEDGKFDDDATKALIGDAAFDMDVDIDNSNLSDANNYADVMTYKAQKRHLWGAMYNLGSCSSANLNEVKGNLNSKSNYPDKMFACREDGWSVASAAFVLSATISQIYGACDGSKAGTVQAHTDGNSYVCKNNMWSVASADDIEASAIAARVACTSTNDGKIESNGSSYFICQNNLWTKLSVTPIDYSKGRAMNAKLGRGMNMGNSWEAESADDSGWSNPIQDGDFATIKAAGFNSVRIPVRWYTGVDTKLAGVQADVDLAMQAGLTVIINYHHYQPMLEAAKSYPNGNYPSEKQNFLNVWKRVATTFNKYDDDKLVFEIFNEPRDMTQEAVDDIMLSAYEVIRAAAPGKTIMFEGNGYSKFAQIAKLKLPADGNIIVSGHYYEPYSFTHQGHDYDCNANAKNGISSMAGHFKSYVDSIAVHFPDINGGTVPINLGEFGVANQGSCRSISESDRAKWTDAVIEQAEKYGMSWHYWAYSNAGGFEAAPGRNWSTQMLQVFQKYMK